MMKLVLEVKRWTRNGIGAGGHQCDLRALRQLRQERLDRTATFGE